MKFKFYITVCFIFLYVNTFGYEPQFSQFYSNPLYLAPSFSGAIEGSRVVLNYRNQWPGDGLPASFRTFSFSYDQYFSNFNSGIGFIVLRDVAGSSDYGLFNLGLQYSYNFQIFNVVHVRPGMGFYYTQIGVDYNKLNLITHLMADDPTQVEDNDIIISKDRENALDIDFNSSLLIYSNRLWFGGTVDHLLKPNMSLYSDKYVIPLKYSFYGGFQVIKYKRLLKPIDETLTIAALYKQQDTQKQFDMGLYWHKSPLVFGLWYRGLPFINSPRGDALIVLAGYKVSNFSIGYSYDFTISNLLPETWGAHEVSLVYKFHTPERRKKRGSVPCPEF